MNKKTIDKKFDEQFGEQVDKDTMWHFGRAGIDGVKQFIHEQIEEVIDYISFNEGWEETGDIYREEFGYEPKYKKARDMGYKK